MQATLEHTHALLRVTPNDDPHYRFELAIPKAWAHASAFGPVRSGPFEERGIGIFAGGGDPGSPVIGVMPSPFEIPIDGWVRAKLAHDGWDVVSAFWFPGPSGLYFDITAVRVAGDSYKVQRSSVRSRGNDIFSVNCTCALEHWAAAKEYFLGRALDVRGCDAGC